MSYNYEEAVHYMDQLMQLAKEKNRHPSPRPAFNPVDYAFFTHMNTLDVRSINDR